MNYYLGFRFRGLGLNLNLGEFDFGRNSAVMVPAVLPQARFLSATAYQHH